jgi:hypothetical protein
MRVLLSTIGSRGDVQPLVALALQLRAPGQEVRLCVPPISTTGSTASAAYCPTVLPSLPLVTPRFTSPGEGVH